MVGAQGKPWLSFTKPALFVGGHPWHRRARAVPAECERPVGDGFGILKFFERYVDLCQRQFFALPDDDIPAQRYK